VKTSNVGYYVVLFTVDVLGCGCCRLYEMQDDEDEAEKMPSVAERIKQMESKKIRFSAMRDKAAKRRYILQYLQ